MIRLTTYNLDLSNMTSKFAAIQLRGSVVSLDDATLDNTLVIPNRKPGGGNIGYYNTQQFQSLYAWNDIVSVVVTTTLSIASESIQGPLNKATGKV